jgi:hypothetical protein
MFKMTAPIKKYVLAVLILVIGLAALPITGASAVTLNGQSIGQPDNYRLEKIWASEQRIYQHDGVRLANTSNFITWVQTQIDKANQKGWDIASTQAALNAISAVLPAVQAAHNPGTTIITSHAGFDANGDVTDRTTAIVTAKALALVLKDTRTAKDGTGKALREAIRASLQTHPRPIPSRAS